MATASEIQALLAAIRSQITAILTTGQSYTVDGNTVQRVPLAELRRAEKAAELELAQAQKTAPNAGLVSSEFVDD